MPFVDRRIGGLENQYSIGEFRRLVDRRIGGLEIIFLKVTGIV